MKKRYLLIFSFIIAIFGIGYGLPMHFIGDEESLIGGAIKMMELKNLFPVLAPEQLKLLYYPPIIPYLYILAFLPVIIFKFFVSGFDLLSLKDYFVTDLDLLWISARLTTAVFSIGILVIVYQISKIVFSKKSAYLSTALLAFSFFHVLLSSVARHWIFTVFLVYLIILLTLWFVHGHIKKYWLIGLAVGVAMGTSYVTFLVLPLVVLILWFYRQQIINPIKKILINISLALAVGAPLVFINLPDLLRFKYGGDLLGEPLKKSFVGFLYHLVQVVTVLFNQELLILFLAIFALLLWKRNIKIKIFISFFIFIYCFVLYYFLHFEGRYIYFVMPALAILSADFLVYLSEKIPNLKVYYLLLILLFLWPALGIFHYKRLLLVDDTRELAVQYIEQEISDKEFLLSSPHIRLPRSYDSLTLAQEQGHINATETYIYNNYDRLANNFEKKYNYQNIHFWKEDLKNQASLEEYIDKHETVYFVLEYWSDDGLEDYYSYLRKNAKLVKIFRQSNLGRDYNVANGNFWAFNTILFKLDRLGPSVEIYQLK